jgi:hypothetical protein
MQTSHEDLASPQLREVWKRLKENPGGLLHDINLTQFVEDQRKKKLDFSSAKAQRKRVRLKKKKAQPFVRSKTAFAAYEPDQYTVDDPCCKKKCCTVWKHKEKEIGVIRSAILDVVDMSTVQQRDAIWKARPLLGDHGDCCIKWLKCVFGVRSNDKLYGSHKTVSGRARKDPVRISIIAWFQGLLETADKMPDNADYVLPAPSRKSVWHWYNNDHDQHPDLYIQAGESYFNTVWREYFPDVKLRKYLRFHKCSLCVSLRQIRWDRTSSKASKAQALKTLEEHYKWIKKERGYSRLKSNRAVLNPQDCISIAIDGCENLPKASRISQR